MRLRTGVKWQSPCLVCFISFLLSPLARAQEHNYIRLVDGRNPYEGRLEIFQDGVWLSVCLSYVSSHFGKVVCRQLGYPPDGAVLYYANSYGSAPGEILRKNISCNGQEASLSSCDISPREQNCDPRYTLGVSCDTGLSERQTVRLVNGTSQYEGRVEVFKAGVWGSVMERNYYSEQPLYNAIAVNVVCRILFGPSYGGSVVPQQEAILRFGVARRIPIQISYVTCEGNEQTLFNCSYSSPWSSETLEDSLAVVCKQVPDGCNWYRAEPSGTINSPGFPQGAVYSNNTDCVWTIVNKAGRIQLSFTNLQVNTSLTTSMNILRVIDSDAYSNLAYIQWPTTVATLQSSGNKLYVWLKAQSATKGIQFQASWDVPPCFQRLTNSGGYIQSPGYPNQYQPNLNCTYEIVKRKGVFISFSFYDFALGKQQGGVCRDVLQIFDGDSQTSPTVGGPLCGTTRPPVMRTSNVTSTLVLVRFMSDAINTSVETGFRIYYSQVEPDPIRPGNYTADVGSFKSPGYPNVYNDEEDVIWTITTKPYKTITLSFQDVQLLGFGLNYISVYDRVSGYTNIYNSGSVSPIISSGNNLEVKLRSSLDNGLNKFKASWTTECRQVFQSTNGVITSPNDQEYNTSSADCTYIIRQQAGYYIRIQFSSINFEKDATCRNYVEIRDGSTEFFPVLGEKYCGLSLPPPLTSTQNVVFIKFNTQIGNNYFNLGYSSHPKVCDKGLMTDSEGSFTSPGFPIGYPSNTYCVWTIKVDDNKATIDLTFDDFSVGSQGTQCQYAFVRVYDGAAVDANTVITTLCGTAVPPKLRSTGSSLTVVLNVFGSLVNANGFRATYSARRSNGGLPKGLYPYGVAANDGILGSSTQTIPLLEEEFPFGLIPQSTVNVGRNGILSFEKGTAWPWLDYSRHAICVYCTYISDEQSVYYHLYGIKDLEVLNKATYDVQEFTGSKRFQASMVFVVTWDRVKQYFPSVDFKPTDMGDATFQVALVSDSSESYALVQYRVGHMTWRYPGRWYSIQMGVAKGSLTTYRPNVYSGTELAYEMDTHFGNTGYKGYWVYELGKAPANYHKTCQDWFRRNKVLKDEREAGFAALPRCPCSRRGIFRAVINQWRFHRRDEQNYFECYMPNLARTGQFAPFGKECCYSTNPLKPDTLDMLITSPPFAGAALAFNPLVFAQEKLYDSEDRMPHVACCEHGTNKQCRQYYNLRPIGKCNPNPGIQWIPLYGEPLITTMDGREYLFNGLGEFTLVSLKTSNVTFTLQARTQRAELRPGTPTNGTVFTAVGAEENGVRVFLQIDPNTNTTLVVYAKDVDYTRRFVQEGDNFTVDDKSFMLHRDNDTCVVSFPSGISLQIYIRMKALVIGIAMPRNFRNLTKGLLGNFNGDPTDDFILPSGERLNNSLSERQIFNLFANKWLVDANNSVMRYEARMGPADFYRQDFQPVFLDEVDPSRLTEAKVLCGATNMPCIYDFLATGDRSFAFETSDLRNLSDILIQQSENTAPLAQVPELAYIIVGVPQVIVVTGVDPDVNDVLTYHLVDDQNQTLSINQSSGSVTVSLTSLKPIKIMVYVVDSQGAQSPVESIPIVACSGCLGHGTCNMSDTRDVLGDHDFQFAVCRCGPAWAGDNCELDRDGCSDSPCHPLRTCTDIPASRQGASDIGYTCSACPRGFFTKNHSSDCYDVDECLNSTLHDCNMLCINTYGSYECSCQEGYRLSTNGHSCTDINECVERTHDCQQICNNTAGGYQCECEAGYTYDSRTRSCIINSNESQVCRTSTCSQGCRVITDAANNNRPQCFCYLGYDLDPRDNATCVDRDECRDKVCDQVCNNTAGGFSCSCYDGFALNKDERTCSACPYLKYGPECRETCTCSGRSVACHPVRGCVCQDGWTGPTCMDDVDECVENPDVCGLNRACVNSRGSYSCVCRAGYALDSNGVCQDVNECTTDVPCKENEECTNNPGSYYCSCNQGYSKTNSTNCTDVDECSANRGDCQHDCVNVLGSFNCECKYGYRVNADRKTCTQVRETCVDPAKCIKAHGCVVNESNNDVCFCNSGYIINQNTQTCEDFNECETGLNKCSHTCSNTLGSFNCSCPMGMKLDNNKLTCSDCSAGTFGPNCSQVCACAAGAERCDPVSGCVCRQGWEGDKCDKDVDECQSVMSPANCTGQNVECVNTNGGYTCRCRQGFAADNNSVCQDIDECSEPVCDQHCNNTVGSFLCTCDAGFLLDAVTQTCKDVDECAALETNVCTQRCENTVGSYRCFCNGTGYSLNNDGFTCRDIDECANGLAKCSHTCSNSPGSFICNCPVGMKLDNDWMTCSTCPAGTFGPNCTQLCACAAGAERCDPVSGCVCRQGWEGDKCDKDVDECQLGILSANCRGENVQCINTNGGYTCRCLQGFAADNDSVCQDVDECSEPVCDQNCNNTISSFYCTCNDGFYLDAVMQKCRDEIEVQLVNGPNPYEGRVEILRDGVWLSVCHQYVSSNFGSVVCRQLNYPTDGSVLYYANSYGQAPGEILRKYINCTGEELSLSNCSFSSRDQSCDPRYTLGVSCDTGVSEVQTVRLVNGTSQYEGRVEVFKAGVWGSVTASRDLATRPLYSALAANIVCRTLFGANYSGSAVPQQEATMRFGSARSAIHMSSVRCQGDEQNLFNCIYDDVLASEIPETTLAVVCKQVPKGCNGYVAEPNGTITSPGFPEGAVYSSDTDCVWTIVNKAGWIRFSLTNIQIERRSTASLNILRVIDSDAYSNLAYIRRPTAVGALQSSGSTLYLWLKAQSETKGVQFQASWETPPCFQRLNRRKGYIQSPDFPNPYQANLSCTYEIVKQRGFRIRFSFKVFELGEQQDGVCQDVLQIFDGNSELSPIVGGPLCGPTPLSVLKTKNQNSTIVLVRFMSDAVATSAEKGYRIHYNQIKSGWIQLNNYTEESGTFTSPGYPDVYNGEEDVLWTITTKPYKTITLSFQDVRLGPCCRNKILVTEKPVHKRTEIKKSGPFSTIISGGKILRIKMVSAKKNLNKFKASWTTECRQVFQTSNGIINSPDDPDFNMSPADCTYIIKQQLGYYINIQFSSLNLEEDVMCRNYIEVHDGATEFSPLLGEKYCGLSLPPPLTSTQNVVLMKFNTQTGYNNFSLTYSSHSKECEKGLMTDSEGNFTSPGFPLGYPTNTYCVWTIKVDDDEAVIDLAFTDFSVGSQGPQCQNAFVRVYDGAVVDTSTVMTTLCGATFPQGLRSTRNSLTIVLNVFGSVVNATGFRATYTTTRLTADVE
ncbi:uncharacterized protein LOC112554482 isoform X2 [Pomacea canaliculata]|uniref:uncharacterized protein LOC112554482 isoform X2 n=1 Tax=Pomacea canaliculata TaxID=400727 RepID=UPI000D72D295|nr:uncharacterized protein LOC112554482 isoform X2 [Pomacea canaliculata]